MKKLILVATAVLFALGVGIAGAADMPAGELMIDSGNGKKTGVTFSHEGHKGEGLSCEQCHHKVDGAENMDKCGKCHTIDGGDAPKLKDALHGKAAGVCTECHTKKGAANKMKCGDCHKK